MTTEQMGVHVYRDEDGNLYLRVPDEQKADIEQAMVGEDASGHLLNAGERGIIIVGGLTRVGYIGLTGSLASRGIIIVGGRTPS